MNDIRMLVFDIDGVITDGKRYIGEDGETKTVSLKDLDAIGLLHQAGYKVGCISGEDTPFSRSFSRMAPLDHVSLGCKTKTDAIHEIGERFGFSPKQLCYIGDGKYDIPVLELAGLSVCPADAIDEVKRVSDVVLRRKGGEGCIAECYTLLTEGGAQRPAAVPAGAAGELIRRRMAEHGSVLDLLTADEALFGRIDAAIGMINDCYRNDGCLYLCGNGGSAADAQHLAAEMVGRFYLERPALRAEALTVNSSILTALSNDYEFNMVFARQLEGRARSGDVLVGITTSGTSGNILKAFQKAKQMGMQTVLMTGAIDAQAPILSHTDCLIDVPSRDTPRIQEMHILIGHIICEAVEAAAVAAIEKEKK